jgi:hypothetical protein
VQLRSRPGRLDVSDANRLGQCRYGGLYTYCNFKVHHLLRKRAHLIAEAKPILTRVICRKDKIPLLLFRSVQNDLVLGSHDAIVNVE